MRKIETWVCVAALLVSTNAFAEKSVLAIFEVESSPAEGGADAGALRVLDAHLVTRLGETEGYEVVPKADLADAVALASPASVGFVEVGGRLVCAEDACRLELARAVGASRLFSAAVARDGDRCVVSGILADIETSARERVSADAEACDVEALVRALDRVVEDLTAPSLSRLAAATSTASEAPSVAAPAPSVAAPAADAGVPDASSGQPEVSAQPEASAQPDVSAQPEVSAQPATPEVPRPPALTDRTARLLKTPDGRACGAGDGDACARVASLGGATRVAWRHADRGCQLGHTSSCQWAAKIAYELGEKTRARAYARYACALGDAGGCGWYAKIEHEIGSRGRAKEAALEACHGEGHGASCVWAASFAYEAGQRARALELAKRGCAAHDGESCGWVVKLEVEARHTGAALAVAGRSCQVLKHGPSCTWAATLDAEAGNRPRALESALAGCALADAGSCAWATQLAYELGQKDRALEVSARACQELRDGVACAFGALIEHELGHAARALDVAQKGCALQDFESCDWVRRLSATPAP